MNILIVSAHPDDEALSMGATIQKHVQHGDTVYFCILSGKVNARADKDNDSEITRQTIGAQNILGIKEIDFFDFPNIKMNAVPILDIVQSIESSIEKYRPEIIYTHHWGDLNIDHRVVYDATMAAIRLPQRGTTDMSISLIKKVLCFETPSSTEWAAPTTTNAFLPTVFVEVSEEQMHKKIESIKAYKGALRELPHARSEEAIFSWATIRGAQAGFRYAESFVLIRELK